jgi:hypothetical protein
MTTPATEAGRLRDEYAALSLPLGSTREAAQHERDTGLYYIDCIIEAAAPVEHLHQYYEPGMKWDDKRGGFVHAHAPVPVPDELREALEQTIAMLDRLDAQARDGGGPRREVYLTVEAWREVFVPLRAKALAALAQPLPDNRPTHLPSISSEVYYSGQHDDCIATTSHYHARPYRLGDWAAVPVPDGLREAERHAIDAILDRPSADPDDDAAVVARAALRLAGGRRP